MKKAELAARYDNFGRDLIEISLYEFYQVVDKLDHAVTWRHFDASTEICTISTDGVEYMCYGSTYSVQGGHDGDSFYCKLVTMTQAEREKLRKLFA
jgi:hypothetical protein